MDRGARKNIDKLCQRRSSFALYRLPGDDTPLQFCMQADGGMERRGLEEAAPDADGFLLAPFDAPPFFIRRELDAPPDADGFAPLPPDLPRRPATTREEYARLFALYTRNMPQPLSKVVLARALDEPPPPGFSPAGAFLRAAQAAPRAFNALLHTPDGGTWLCSTPELLLRGRGDCWESMALAGTRPAGTARPWDVKNRHEHAIVASHVRRVLAPLSEEIQEAAPAGLTAGPVEHLCSRFRWRMPAERVAALLAALPPTPAVSGSPEAEARALLRAHPDVERGFYAGYAGPRGAESAELYVTLRCMRVYSDRCRLYAGGGLLPDSDEETEWRETEAKMQPMRRLLHTDD